MTVAVLGNAAIDLVFEVEAVPRPGASVTAARRRTDLGGKGLNQAIAARRAGAEVRLCAVVGEDAHGAAIERRLREEGIDPAWLLRRDRPTDESLIFVTPDGENAVLGISPPEGALDPDAARAFLHTFTAGDLLVIGGALLPATRRAALATARERGMEVLLNPPPDLSGPLSLPAAGTLVANRREVRLLGGVPDIERAVSRLRAAGFERIVVTLGAGGAVWFEGDLRIAVPAPPTEAVDSTGAGDLLLGVLAAGLDHGLPPALALRRAVAAASLSVGRHGTLASFPDRAEMAALFASLEREGEAVVHPVPRE